MPDTLDRHREWLEADGLGGFASGTPSGVRTRRYHALLLAAERPPADRRVLVNGLEVHVETTGGRIPLSTQRYLPDVVHPNGWECIEHFELAPWPRWRYRLPDGTTLEHELVVPHGRAAVVLRWRLTGAAHEGPVTLRVRPLLSGRDPHALQRENGSFRFEAEPAAGGMRWHSYDGVPAVLALGNGSYQHAPDWYRNFLLTEERARGLDHVEDLASPGELTFDLAAGAAWLALVADLPGATTEPAECAPDHVFPAEAARREALGTVLDRAADAYIVQRGSGRTIIAGYPWFGDWGRDTFIALRGLCLATGRLDDAGAILNEWAGAVSEGMLPNRFPDRGDTPEYNSVDAALWFVIVVHEYFEARTQSGRPAPPREVKALRLAVDAILDGHARGTRHGIRMDEDGLLAAGAPGVQLTWMDASIDDWVVTPRIGKPVEIQALWLNALRVAGAWTDRWDAALARGLRAFETRFWNEASGCLHDVIDVSHVRGLTDATIRPNQLFAVGGLPWPILRNSLARRVVDVVERELWTPLGPRSLAPGSPGYAPRYEGGVLERDSRYHQGTVWPWLAGPFVEAWLRVRSGSAADRAEARERFLAPLLAHLREAGMEHVSEIADAEAPHVPRGCPFQAWSVGELLRLDRLVLAELPSAGPA